MRRRFRICIETKRKPNANRTILSQVPSVDGWAEKKGRKFALVGILQLKTDFESMPYGSIS
ncbi:hypothetical protein BpHYR1_028430 [Brachionus plicatilis]|uniref:Uncharacterized protein n=1 Tax=Brachionus plicatilis TaxID=10195 RepID=A0A3M7S2W1_BRAPC|nr:hypothetical protein BpHYR1_028430 [Brachionus plicatilis]